MLAPDADVAASKDIWRRLYRAADHAYIEQQCRSGDVRKHSLALQAFASEFVARKNLREKADYDALATFEITEVRKALEVVESHLQRFEAEPSAAKRAFAVFVALRIATRP